MEREPFVCPGCPGDWCPGCVPDEVLSEENPQWVHLTGSLQHATWTAASRVELDRSGWGTAIIDEARRQKRSCPFPAKTLPRYARCAAQQSLYK
jgi:hypothetical protein